MLRFATIALLLFACNGGPATHSQTQTLSLIYKQGATYHYTFHMTIDFSVDTAFGTTPMKYDITAKEATTVSSVDTKGVADLAVTLTDISLTITLANNPTTTSTGSKTPPTRFRIGPDGQLISSNATTVLADNPMSVTGGGSVACALLPDHAVKPGETWSKAYDQPNGFGTWTAHETSNSVYLRDETFHGVRAAVVETTTMANIDTSIDVGGSPETVKGTSSSDVTSWVDPGGHRLLKTSMRNDSHITYSAVALPGPEGSVTWRGPENVDLESS
jgi:hypothetical protein